MVGTHWGRDGAGNGDIAVVQIGKARLKLHSLPREVRTTYVFIVESDRRMVTDGVVRPPGNEADHIDLAPSLRITVALGAGSDRQTHAAQGKHEDRKKKSGYQIHRHTLKGCSIHFRTPGIYLLCCSLLPLAKSIVFGKPGSQNWGLANVFVGEDIVVLLMVNEGAGQIVRGIVRIVHNRVIQVVQG